MKSRIVYTDAALIAAISSRDDLNEVIYYIYQQYAAVVGSFVMRNSGTRQDAEDIFQETVVAFIETVRNEKFRGQSAIKTFIVSIARNLWLNELNKRKRSDYRETVFENNREEQENDISHLISDREAKQQFRAVLGKLGDPCKKLLLLFYYENLSMKEIVTHLPYDNEQVVRNKKYKCLQQLTGFLKKNPALTRLISMRN